MTKISSVGIQDSHHLRAQLSPGSHLNIHYHVNVDSINRFTFVLVERQQAQIVAVYFVVVVLFFFVFFCNSCGKTATTGGRESH